MLGQRGGDFEGGQGQGQGQGTAAAASQSGPSYDQGGFGEPEDDDIPF